MKIIIFLIFLSTVFLSCQKDKSTPGLPTTSLPTVTTTTITSIAATTAIGGGNVSSDGGATVTVRGICWGTAPNPFVSGIKTTDGSGTGVFTSSIESLIANTTYYCSGLRN